MKTRGRKKGQLTTVESWMIKNARPGAEFYTIKQSKDITAIAAHHNRKVTTERLIVVAFKSLEAGKITKVTLL